jgi:predicted nucleic acid-binding protein
MLMLTPLGAAGNLTSDAHLAALAIEHGAGVPVQMDVRVLTRVGEHPDIVLFAPYFVKREEFEFIFR